MSIRLGLDIGRKTVKLVRIDTTRKTDEPPRLIRGATREIDPKASGPALRDATVRAIRECAAELGVARATVAIAVPRAEAVLKTVFLPPVPPDERTRLIRFQAAKDVPFELSDVVLASGVVGVAPLPPAGEGKEAGTTSEVNYAAVRTAIIDSLRGLVRDAGLVPGPLEISSQAAARAARLLVPEAENALLVLVGAIASDIVLLRNGRIAFSRSASVGAGEDPQETGSATGRWLERLTAEITRSLRASTVEAGPPQLLLLGGGGAAAPNVAKTLAAQLGVPSRVLDPLGNGDSAAFLVARGLAEARRVTGIPLLDFAGIADAKAARGVRQRAIAAGGLVALLLACAAGMVWKSIGTAETQAEQYERDLRDLKPSIDTVKGLLHEVQTAERWEQRKGRSLDVLLAVAKSLPPDDGAYLLRFQWSEGHIVYLTGRARDQDSVERFVRRLDREPIVERATPDTITHTAGKTGVDFNVTAKLHDLPGEKTK